MRAAPLAVCLAEQREMVPDCAPHHGTAQCTLLSDVAAESTSSNAFSRAAVTQREAPFPNQQFSLALPLLEDLLCYRLRLRVAYHDLGRH
jgi:hypothetical protein